jgi:hypothetical protein
MMVSASGSIAPQIKSSSNWYYPFESLIKYIIP